MSYGGQKEIIGCASLVKMVPARIIDEYVAGVCRKVNSVSLTCATSNPTSDILPGGRRHLRDILMPAKLIHTIHAQPEVRWKVTIVKASSSSVASRYVEHSIIGSGSSFEDGFPITLNEFQRKI
ncbi:hypothetical protein GE21DRAFT_8824 [Neurospora crassa]|uniref:Uncharacterized protein n=1 Tax=Neurospora crassa (strain ATCC 24698 / 74-OR23-1A / CBS 708.71 / DSM 1257 / FGSC 987) TaxID=367110 RepID=V5ILD7_NEUCR|nr:hypothetical protein NCU12091 [Neurospora crassa OR74A]ESA42160.1 hypothetical protein NCU12091 [Neurospora crassa OR74A]KHE89043.1 hypothetical protein GE21DRAFT_8824 [Neurospora crassa]|eukprot:XP_011395044.1 hypothetical protein NCU12091 [Neurospora crassa OR74A]